MPEAFRFHRRFDFPVAPAVLWATLADPAHYLEWWGWLRSLDGDGFAVGGLRAGTVARCAIETPLPYSLKVTVTVERVLRGRLVATAVDGDLRGPASLEVHAGDGGGSAAVLAWTLDVQHRRLRALAGVARPVMAWAHDRIVDNGLRDFRERALREATALT